MSESLGHKAIYRYAVVGCVVISVLFVVSGMIFYRAVNRELTEIKETQQVQSTDYKETNQFLLSTIDWSTLRQKKILFMRDQIVYEWRRIGYGIEMHKAFLIAETNMRECEKYPHIDPLLVLAMQLKESSFLDTVISPMGALGLNQVMPATGRLLCGYFNIEYSDSLLFSIEVSTMLAVKLLDVLHAQYGNVEQILAGYNGGPYQAYYYVCQKEKLAKETAEYVPFIITKKQEYAESLKSFRIDARMKAG